MSEILTHNDISRTQWSALVHESKTGTWFQTPEAYDFFASQPGLFRPFVFVVVGKPESKSGQIDEEALRGVCVGYVTMEKNVFMQFFTRRAIIIGGPALADDCTDEEVETLMKAVRSQLQSQAIYIETRNFNDYSQWMAAFKNAGFEYYPHLNFHVDCTDKEQIWERQSENRKRQIKKQTNTTPSLQGMDISEQDIRDWYGILKELYRKKVKTPLFPLSFFLEAHRQRIGKFLLVKHEGKVIGGSMLVESGKKAAYEWFECGLNNAYKDQYPSVMATYAGMEYAAEHNLPRYDMMGAGEPNKPYGVRDFKAEFGGEMVEQGRFLYIAKPMLYQIGKLGVEIRKRC